MKNLGSPPTGVIVTARVVLPLLGEKINPNDADDKVWKKFQLTMNQPEKFLERVTKFNGKEIEASILENVNKIIQDPSKKYNEDDMKGQNYAASKLCAWSTNIVTFNKIYKEVRPLQLAKDKAVDDLDTAMKDLNKVKEEVRKLNEKVDGLRKQLDGAQ
jgi:dynein heavy chain